MKVHTLLREVHMACPFEYLSLRLPSVKILRRNSIHFGLWDAISFYGCLCMTMP